MKTIDIKDKKMITDAVELGKSNFIAFYKDQGFKEDYLSEMWHKLKTTEYARSIVGKSGSRYQAPESEIKQAYKDIGIETEKPKKRGRRKKATK